MMANTPANAHEYDRGEMAKSFLSQTRQIDRLIENKLEQIKRLRALSQMASRSVVTASAPGAPRADSIGGAVARVDGLEAELGSQIRRLVDLLSQISAMVERVGSLPVRAVLEQRYLSQKAWTEIAEAMGCSLRKVYSLHTRGLQVVGRMLEGE